MNLKGKLPKHCALLNKCATNELVAFVSKLKLFGYFHVGLQAKSSGLGEFHVLIVFFLQFLLTILLLITYCSNHYFDYVLALPSSAVAR